MRIPHIVTVLSILFAVTSPPVQAVGSHGDYDIQDLEVEVWFDQTKGSVYEPGEEVEIYFSTSHDCYVVVYDVDTQGFINVLFPRGRQTSWVEAERIHSIPDPYDDYDLTVEGPKGIEYVVAVASPYPLNVGTLYDQEGEGGYYYSGRVAGDPHQAIFELNERLAWGSDAYSPEGYASDVGWFYVEREVPYPRYMVYHWYPNRFWDPYWDPYLEAGFYVDFYWDHAWCRPWWWCHGCRPVYDYWYVNTHGVRVKWKTWHHHDPWEPDWRRVKPPRWDARLKSPRLAADKSGLVRSKDPRNAWRDPDRRAKRILEGDHHVREREARKAISPERRHRDRKETPSVDRRPERRDEPRKPKQELKPRKPEPTPARKPDSPRKAEPKRKSEPEKKDSKDSRPRKR